MIEHGDWARLAAGDACGYLAIAGLLIETTRRRLKATRLGLGTSGDTAGPRDRVVGYGAWMFAENGGIALGSIEAVAVSAPHHQLSPRSTWSVASR